VSEGAERSDTTYDIYVPPEHEAGVYANLLFSWHTPDEFTLDFAAARAPRHSDEDPPLTLYQVVARVRLPVTLVFEVIRTLNDEMTKYEKEFGEIRRPKPLEGQ
jgi:hypothetical protein